jgi:hypothetical protein
LADDERPKRGRAGHGHRRDAPRGHPVRPCRPRTPRATRRYKKPPPRPQGSPNPSRLGGFNPLPTYSQAGGEGEGGEKEENGGARSSTTRREAGAASEEEPDPREPSTPATPASSDSPSSRRLSASPTSAAAFLITASHTSSPTPSPLGPLGPSVSTAFPFSLWTPRPSSRGGTFRATAPPRRRW